MLEGKVPGKSPLEYILHKSVGELGEYQPQSAYHANWKFNKGIAFKSSNEWQIGTQTQIRETAIVSI